jgi:cytoskeleton protein RodZ
MLNSSSNNSPSETVASDARVQRLAPHANPPQLDPTWRAGRKLSEARQQLGLSLDEVAERIRVRREFLDALEQMNVKLLPGKAYALAFLRSYARALGIDEKAIVDQFQDECALSREDAEKPIRAPSTRPRRERPWLWAAGVVLAGVAVVGWRAVVQHGPEQAPTEQAAINPGAPIQAHAAAEARVVEIKALTEGWLEARGPDGTVFLSRTLHPGDVYRPDASPGWTLHARDGAAFELFVNGMSAGPLGPPGMPVR